MNIKKVKFNFFESVIYFWVIPTLIVVSQILLGLSPANYFGLIPNSSKSFVLRPNFCFRRPAGCYGYNSVGSYVLSCRKYKYELVLTYRKKEILRATEKHSSKNGFDYYIGENEYVHKIGSEDVLEVKWKGNAGYGALKLLGSCDEQ